MVVSLKDIISVRKPIEVYQTINKLLKKGYKFVPVGGMPNNAGPIELATEPVSPLIERTTNMFDGVLELLAEIKRSGQSLPESPREAVARWAEVKGGHVYNLSHKERQKIADQVEVIIDNSGAGKDKSPTLIFRDRGIGLHPLDWPNTILSLNKGNKIDKLYLAGAYGQGGSSTFAFCPYSIIISRRDPRCLGQRKDSVGWTIVRINDTDDSLKNAVYEYLVDSYGNIPTNDNLADFEPGTYIAHIAYNAGPTMSKRMTLTSYKIFNNLLFDPILPYWIRDYRYNDNRTMGGHISRLLPDNKMVEHKDEFIKNLGPDSKLVVRYWVFKVKSEDGKNSYLSGFLETEKSPETILITLNGQKQGTLTKSFLKQLGLSFLANYLLIQIECDGLNRKMKRSLFSSTREKTKNGETLEHIKSVLTEVLNEDEELQRLESERKELKATQMDEESKKKVRKLLDRYISKYLTGMKEIAASVDNTQINGIAKTKLGQVTGKNNTEGKSKGGTTQNRKPLPPPIPIPPVDPPTFLKITSSDPLKIYPGGSAWIRVECNAPNDFLSRPINAGSMSISFTGLDEARVDGQTGLNGGRMRIKITIPEEIEVGTLVNATVKLEGSGFSPILATCAVLVTEKPIINTEPNTTPFPTPVAPPYEIKPVSREDPLWDVLGWDDETVGDYKHSQGELIFYVSISNEVFLKERDRKKTPDLINSFTNKYMAMIAYNLWLHFQQELNGRGIEEDARQDELKRTADTLILSMRSEADLEQEDE